VAYSVGHSLNDLTAAAWFSYLIVYYQAVRGLSAGQAGIVLFVGQCVDACMTPVVGFLSDRITTLPFGQRKSWHMLGSFLVATSFPFVFGSDFEFVNNFSKPGLLVWACFFVVLFQIGWASTQVAHLSLIPELTPDCNERDFLNSARYGCTILSSVFLFGLSFALLESANGEDELGPGDMFHFALLAYIVVGLGLLMVFYFHYGVSEPSYAEKQEVSGKVDEEDSVAWSDWFKRPLFFQIGGIYMTARVIVNVSQVYLPLFLIETLKMNKTNISVAPLTFFVVGLFATLSQNAINQAVGRRHTLHIGVLVTVGTCVGAFFISPSSPYVVYIIVVGLGAGGTTVLVTALAMEADLIGADVEGSAFVYGSLSFLDKLTSGTAVLTIQMMSESHQKESQDSLTSERTRDASELGPFYRNVLVFVPSLAALACFLCSISTYAFGTYSESNPVETRLRQTSENSPMHSPQEQDVTRSLLLPEVVNS